MHPSLIALAQATATTAAKSSKSSSGSYLPLLIIIAIFVVGYILFIRPRQQRARQQQSASRQVAVGDEVMSAGGIYGRVVALDADSVEVEVSPGVVMTFTRRAISARQQAGGPGGGAGLRRTATTPASQADEEWPAPPDPDVPASAPPIEPGSNRDGAGGSGRGPSRHGEEPSAGPGSGSA